MSAAFSWPRVMAVLVKEFVQMRRDRLTFAMIVGVPILQLVLFGYAINTDPKGLPTAVVAAESTPFTRSFVRGMENSGYFRVVAELADEAEADRQLALGNIQFALVVPSDFSRRVVRGEQPVLLLAADATDPSATGNALMALSGLAQQALAHDLVG